jgi:hypothetical protein
LADEPCLLIQGTSHLTGSSPRLRQSKLGTLGEPCLEQQFPGRRTGGFPYEHRMEFHDHEARPGQQGWVIAQELSLTTLDIEDHCVEADAMVGFDLFKLPLSNLYWDGANSLKGRRPRNNCGARPEQSIIVASADYTAEDFEARMISRTVEIEPRQQSRVGFYNYMAAWVSQSDVYETRDDAQAAPKL